MNVRVTLLEITSRNIVMKQVRKCKHNVTILMHSPGFDFCQMKHWKNIAYSLVTTAKENNANIKLLYVFIS